MTAAAPVFTPTLPIIRLQFTAQADAPLRLPDYAGSMLRGAFGHALRGLTLLPHKDNQPCALKDTCPYCQIFATPPLPNHTLQKFTQMPASYVIEPPVGGNVLLQKNETFSFSLILISRAIAQLPLVIFAFQQALKKGLSHHRSPCTLLQVCTEDGSIIWENSSSNVADLHTEIPPHRLSNEKITLNFLTPLRLQRYGELIGLKELNARALLIALARRWQLLADIHLGNNAPQLDFNALEDHALNITLTPNTLTWKDWSRYSSRQQQAMTLGGLMGTLTLEGNLQPFHELLHIGQWLHVGKETVFGLGRYQLEKP